MVEVASAEVVAAFKARPRLERSVSWTPGALGAEIWRRVWCAWVGAGTMRRDCLALFC
jgi:hypothetical protein